MGFIKRSDGDTNHVIDRVFDDVSEVLDEIVEHTKPDSESDNEPVVVVMPSGEKAN